MNRLALYGVALVLGASLASPALADQGGYKNRNNRGRYSRYDRDGYNSSYRYGTWSTGDRQRLRSIADRLETDTDRLKRSLNENLDESRLNGTNREDDINAVAQALEDAADRLEKQAEDRDDARGAAREVFARANDLDAMIGRLRLDGETRRDWNRVDSDLNVLATLYPRVADRGEWEQRGWDRDQRSNMGWRDIHRGY